MRYSTLTRERLEETLSYDPETGVFLWKVRPARNSRIYPGDVAGTVRSRGHRYITVDGRSYVASQLAWFLMTGDWALGTVRVKDGNAENLAWDNLTVPKSSPGIPSNGIEGRAKYQKLAKENDPWRYREYNFKRYYGITSEDYQRMFAEQGGVCAICKKPEMAKSPWGETKWLSVDHCHSTKKVRGLLCASCNHAIGHSNDDPAVLRSAADYLEHHAAACAESEIEVN